MNVLTTQKEHGQSVLTTLKIMLARSIKIMLLLFFFTGTANQVSAQFSNCADVMGPNAVCVGAQNQTYELTSCYADVNGNYISLLTNNGTNATVVSFTQNSSISATVVINPGIQPGNYTLSFSTTTNTPVVISSGGNPTATGSKTTAVNKIPTPILGVIQPTCILGTGTITVTSPTAFQTFSLDGANFTSYPAGGYVGIAPGEHCLIAMSTSSLMCSSSQACITINAQPATPSAPVAGPNARCGTGTVSLTATGCAGGTLTWYAAASGGSSIATGSPFVTPSISQTTTYYVSCTSAAGCEGPRTAVVATVNAIPDAPTAVVTQPTCFVATGTITISSSTTGLMFSLDGSAYAAYPVGGYTVATGNHTLTARNAAGCTSAPTSVTVNAQPTCVFCSYTQGYWGNKNGLNTLNTSGILNAPLVIGGAGPNTITITSTDISKLNRSLPGGSTPGPLANTGACNISNTCFDANLTQQGRINNNLLSQTITLSLNARLGTNLNNVPILSGCLLTSAGSFPIDESVASYLKCKNTATVLGLLSLANSVLGGSLTPGQVTGGCTVPSYSAINNSVDAINNAFDECKKYIGYGTCTTTLRASNTEVVTTKDEISSFVKVKVSPNPYHDNVTFNIEANISGKAILEIFNLTGQKLNTVFEGNLRAGKGQNIQFSIPEQKRSNLIYRLRVGEKTTTGKILYMN